MSQRAEKEETEFKVPEPLTLCVNNCGVTANPATNNMCQKCFSASTATSSSSSTVAVSTASVLTFTAERSPRSRSSRSPVLTISQPPTIRKPIQPQPPPAESTEKIGVNRCCGCRKKVGLTGFRCRCGELFCGKHRYSDRHDCSYDYKTAGRDAIARENPVVKAAKIVRI